jgi:4a-hydroxytetrahydrobiopterin dehydratase
MALLSEQAVQTQLRQLPGWTLNGNAITWVKTLGNFVDAIAFVNRIVEPAETANHHPDLAISYNKVTITLTTHDAGGLTQKDFDLAKILSSLASP